MVTRLDVSPQKVDQKTQQPGKQMFQLRQGREFLCLCTDRYPILRTDNSPGKENSTRGDWYDRRQLSVWPLDCEQSVERHIVNETWRHPRS